MDPNAVAVASLVIGVAALLVAVPAARPFALVIAVGGIVVAGYFLFSGDRSTPDPAAGPANAQPASRGGRPSIAVSPSSTTQGAAVTVTGSGFPPATIVAFNFVDATSLVHPIDGSAIVDAGGRFQAQATLTASACGQTGQILAYSGTDDRQPDPSGSADPPRAETPVSVACN